MRRIFIGDIQGCFHQLNDLLNALQVQSGDRLYCVGDLVNRGPDSLGVLRRLRDLNAHIVLGNHDIHLLRVCAGTRAPSPKDRFQTVLAAPDRERLIEWLAQQPVMHVEADVVVVHAGLHPAWKDVATTAAVLNAAVAAHVNGRPDESVAFATEARYCDAHGRRPARDDPPPGPPFLPWDRFYAGDRTVVFGHWAGRGLIREARLRGLDTGCVYGGALTAWIAEEDRVLQVPGWQGD